jgi:TonB-dependent starch-binding outer membrane protein SusC
MNKLLQRTIRRSVLGIILIVSPFCLYPQTFANNKIPKQRWQSINNVRQLRDALLDLKSRYKINILFEEGILDGLTVYDSLSDSKSTVEQNLTSLLKGKGLYFQKVKKNSFVILEEADLTQTQGETSNTTSEQIELKETPTETLKELLIQVSGTVVDENGVPVPGANVVEKSTTNGTGTDAEGKYVINVNDANSILVFSFIGFDSQEIKVGTSTLINVKLSPNIKALEEVVVIGYGTRERKDLTGSVVDIKSSEIVQSAALSPQLALQGRMTGVFVSGGGGDPNARPNINIRGVSTFGNSAQPLYIIDGIPVAEFGEGATYTVDGARAGDLRGTQNILNLINPNDIESISVLKDASSAAVYGVRAANGVVLITTKRGKEGRPKIDFSASYGVRNLRKTLDVLNTQEYTALYQKMIANDKNAPPVWAKYYDPTNTAYLGNSPTYDWQNEIINKDAITANYTVGISGGTEFSNYNIGAGYSKQESSLKFNTQDRYSFSANSDFKVKKWLEIGETFRLAYTKLVDNRDNSGVPTNLVSTFDLPPWQPIYDATKPDGIANTEINNVDATLSKYGPETGGNFVGANRYTNQEYNTLRTLGSAYFVIKPVKGLRIKGTLGADYTDNKRAGWSKTGQLERFNPTANGSAGNTFTAQNTLNYGITQELTISYSKKFGEHSVELLANASNQEINFNGLNTGVTNIPLEDPSIYTITSGSPKTVNTSQFKETNVLQGYLGRVSYKYKDKYYFDGTLMRNGSSNFARVYRWGTFPAISAAWRISGENFFKNVSFVTDLKIRGGWGQLGNQDTKPFSFVSTVNRNPQYTLSNTANGSGSSNIGAFLGDYANVNLTWEKVSTLNVGFDAAFFSGALTFTTEYYNRTTDGILQGVAFPATSGLNSSPIFNIAKVQNQGIELAVNYNKRVSNDLSFSVGANITTVSNKVLSLYQGNTLYNGNTRIKEGQSINAIYGFKTDGIFQTDQEVTDWLSKFTSPGNTTQLSPGDFRFKDLYSEPDEKGAPDGIVNGFDQTYLGKIIPGYFYGINLGANYKNFDFSALLQGVGDVQKVNNLRSANGGELMVGRGNNFMRTTLNSWTPENKSTTFPRAIYSDPSGNTRFSDRWIESGAFLRLNNIQVGYTLPKNILSKIGASAFRFYVQSTNTFVITSYTGLDPENDFVPTPRAIIFGVNASF